MTKKYLEQPVKEMEVKEIIKTWIQIGGVVNYDDGLYLMGDGEFKDLARDFHISPENEDEFARYVCRQSLENAGVPEWAIDKLMDWENEFSQEMLLNW